MELTTRDDEASEVDSLEKHFLLSTGKSRISWNWTYIAVSNKGHRVEVDSTQLNVLETLEDIRCSHLLARNRVTFSELLDNREGIAAELQRFVELLSR